MPVLNGMLGHMHSQPTLVFATSNPAKLATARDHLAPFGFDVEQVRVDPDEIQSISVVDVAKHKAQQAHRTLGHPVMIEVSGFCIDEFAGWPGPMVKHLIDAVGSDGVTHLADLTTTRACRFTSALVYIEANDCILTFTDTSAEGHVADKPASATGSGAWSALWEVFVASGTSTPLAALNGPERDALLDRWRRHSVFAQLGRWLTSRRTDP